MLRISRIALVAGFIAVAGPAQAQLQTKKITLEDCWAKPTFRADGVWGLRPMKDGVHYTSTIQLEDKTSAVAQFSYATGARVQLLFSESKLIPEGKTDNIEMGDYTLSPDEKKVLISTNAESIYRYSTKEDNYVLDLATGKLRQLSANGKQRLATFSPDGQKVVFMRDNNLFLVELNGMKESQITNDGAWNKVINGGTDWVYEEEFALESGIRWSPDSRRIAFMRFDESQVKEFGMTMYNTGLYPEPYSYKYPKAGEKNSYVSLLIYDVTNGEIQPVDVGQETDQYIPRFDWTADASVLSFQRMNRLQNKLELLFADAKTGKSTVMLEETSKTYIEVSFDLRFLPDNKRFIWSSDADGHNHLYSYTFAAGKITGKQQLTTGDFDVVEFYGIDEKTNRLYYQSNEEHPARRAVYSIGIDGKGKKKLSTNLGTNRAEFSTGMKYYINTFSTANTPPVITLHEASGKQVNELVNNEGLKLTVAAYGFAKKEFFEIENAEGIKLQAWMIKPANFDANKKYPVLMHVYGGPGHNTVNDQWERGDFNWHQYLAQQGYIVVSVDNRGTEYRGSAFKKATYGKMGELESADQIAAAQWLKQQSYIDGNRIGIQGWSYGGYMSSLCLAVGADIFKMAISVAPVANWRYYDSIYTERYMGLPKDNGKGYDAFSPTSNMQKIKGKLLLVHGTADDNVHFQNSVEMVNALVKNNVQFDFFMFPDKNHSIYGGNTRLYLFTKMTDYIKANL